MVKAYLRYEAAAAFGVIASTDSSIAYDVTGKNLLAPALETVGVWHVRQGIRTKALTPSPSFPGPTLAVTTIVSSSSSSLVASGYADGSIRIWDSEKGTCETTLNGHKGAVSALCYSKSGSLIASGSKECDIILWDVVAERGLFRLRGHRDQVTDLVFLDSDKILVSSSKDKFMRVWDLETQHCMQIVSGHYSEIWSIDADPGERYLVSGSADLELRVYSIMRESVDGQSVLDNNRTENKWEVLKHLGDIKRQSKHRVANLRFNKTGNLLACQEAGKTVEVFRVLDEAEAKRKAKHRLRRKEKKSTKEAAELTENGIVQHAIGEEIGKPFVTVADVFKLLQTVQSSHKMSSISFCPITSKNSLATLAISLNNNLLDIYAIGSNSAEKTISIELQGHRSAIRSVTLSSDNSLLLSTSHNAVKIWNPSTGSCLRTVESDYGLCSSFGPRNKFAVVGTKRGKIELVDVNSGTLIDLKVSEDKSDTLKSPHSDSIRSIAWITDDNCFVTGSLDHYVKFWKFDSTLKNQDSKGLTQTRYKDMENGVTVIAISPDSKYIAVGLLDNTVKVLFMDSLKLYLSLYGHKLPVQCMDISSDGELIVTGSLDKNLKIWGLDFGDCHKSIFAHSESVMAVRFVHNTHYMFSAGKDRLVKYWDADKFELLLTLEGHHAQIECLAVSSRGDFIVTGSHDWSIRRWDRTEEPFFIEEEKEKRLEEMFEADLDGYIENRHVTKEEVPEEGAVALAGKRTKETLSATDSIIESLDMAEAEVKRMLEHEEEKRKGKVADFLPNSFMHGRSPSEHVLHALSSVRTNDLEQTLLALPFADALKLISYLSDWTSNQKKVELIGRISDVLLQIHLNQLVSTPAAKPRVIDLKNELPTIAKDYKNMIGFNLAASRYLLNLRASEYDAHYRDAKTKLRGIRSRQSKRSEEREETKGRQRKKKQKTSNVTNAWS